MPTASGLAGEWRRAVAEKGAVGLPRSRALPAWRPAGYERRQTWLTPVVPTSTDASRASVTWSAGVSEGLHVVEWGVGYGEAAMVRRAGPSSSQRMQLPCGEIPRADSEAVLLRRRIRSSQVVSAALKQPWRREQHALTRAGGATSEGLVKANSRKTSQKPRQARLSGRFCSLL